jgi:hypothetical protein
MSINAVRRCLVSGGTVLLAGWACGPALADSDDVTELLPVPAHHPPISSEYACARGVFGVDADMDRDGIFETYVVFYTKHGKAIESPAVSSTYGTRNYFCNGIDDICGGSGPWQKGEFQIWFVDKTALKGGTIPFSSSNPDSWVFKSVPGVYMVISSDNGDINPSAGGMRYYQVAAYAERNPPLGTAAIAHYEHARDDTATAGDQAYTFLPTCGSPGVMEIYFSSIFTENIIKDLRIHSICAPVPEPPPVHIIPLPISVRTLFGWDHRLQRHDGAPLSFPSWLYITNLLGNGALMSFQDPTPASPMMAFYRVVATPPPVFHPVIATGAVWRYLDDGSDPGTAWRQPDYDDGNWKLGAAKLGYGQGDEATVVGYGPNATNRYITTYLRGTFGVANPADFSSLLLSLKRDDGAIVYLNGTEVFRSNMPTGAVNFVTLASSSATGTNETTFLTTTVSSNLLVVGTNLVAVEVHQDSPASTDLGFDLELAGTWAGPQPPTITQPPQSQSVPTGSAVSFSFQAVGTPPLTYQWYYGNSAVGGATNDTYSIASATTNNAGIYAVGVSNALGSAYSAGASLLVAP